jgi:DNA recombination protein RmuC
VEWWLAVLFVWGFLVMMVVLGMMIRAQTRRAEESAQKMRETLAGVAERARDLERVVQAVSVVQGEFTSLRDRVSSLETSQRGELSSVRESVAQVQSDVSALRERVGSLEQAQERASTALANSTQVLASMVEGVQREIRGLYERAQAREEMERWTAESLRRLESVMAGSASRGLAGEGLVESYFSVLPAEWVERNVTIKGSVVEFAFKLPNNLLLPIDSKFPAIDLVERLSSVEDGEEQRSLRRDLERKVEEKMREVTKYLDPNKTLTFAVAVVPDAVYELCPSARARGLQMGVVLISYSLLVPFLMLVLKFQLEALRSLDLQRLKSFLDTAEGLVRSLQDELDKRFSQSLKMLENSGSALRQGVGQLSSVMAGLRALGSGGENSGENGGKST